MFKIPCKCQDLPRIPALGLSDQISGPPRDAVDGGSKKVQPGSSRSICLAYAALTPAELAEYIS